MGWGGLKKIGKKIGSVANDALKVASPVVDVFYPGAGQIINQGTAMLDRAGLDDNTFKELDEAGNFVQTYVPSPSSFMGSDGGMSSIFNGGISGGNSSGGLGGLGNIFGGGGGGGLFGGTPDYSGQANAIYNQGQGKANEIYVDAIRGLEDQQYADALAQHQAKSAHSSAVASVSNYNNQARASAQRATQANQLRALRKANKKRTNTLKKTNAILDPYVQAGQEALGIHSGALRNAGALGDQLTSLVSAGAPRTSMLENSFNTFMPTSSGLQTKARDEFIAKNEFDAQQALPSIMEQVADEVQEEAKTEIPKTFKDLSLTKRQKKRLRSIRKNYGKKGTKIYRNHLLQKAQEKPIKRKLKTKLSRLKKSKQRINKKIEKSSSKSSTNVNPRILLGGNEMFENLPSLDGKSSSNFTDMLGDLGIDPDSIQHLNKVNFLDDVYLKG